MRTGWRWRNLSGALLVSVAVLCLGSLTVAQASAPQHHNQKKTAKKPPLPPLPSGPTGPVQQVPLDSIAAVPPQVSYQNNQLTIVSPNSTLGDILRAVRKQTGAEIEIPPAPERVVTHLGPGPARDVVAELLNGSRFNYVLLGSPTDDAQLTRVVLVAKSGAENLLANSAPPANPQVNNVPPGEQPAMDAANEAEQNDDTLTDDAADQAAAEAEQQQQMQQQGQPNPEQPVIKTPQQMLQEMQQRQMQLQQQQVPGQPPVPGAGIPQRPQQ